MFRSSDKPCAWLTLILIWVLVSAASAQHLVTPDGANDVVIRPTDPGGDGAIDSHEHALPNLLSWGIGTWRPVAPSEDLYEGAWVPDGEFLRLDIVLEGLANPPGPVGCCGDATFDPYRYGPNPVQGFVELDIDDDPDTGGETDFPDLRYLGNASRFGGLVQLVSLQDRVARDGSAFDGSFSTPPFIERSGEDFHVSLTNWEISHADIERSDTMDWVFGSGETWLVPGYLFQRAHGYRPFCSGCCRAGVGIGAYDPWVTLRFSHAASPDRTTITLVYPLTNAACADMRGNPSTEPMDVMFTNQNSIEEALTDLHFSALYASPSDRQQAEFVLLAGWESKNPGDYLDPTSWRVTILLGGSYSAPHPDTPFVWSDIHPDAPPGDLTGDGAVNSGDLSVFDALLAQWDGDPGLDGDGAVNGSVEIPVFAEAFNLLDLSYDGLIDDLDREQIAGSPMIPRCDFDHDLDVDQSDFGHMQACMTGENLWPPIAGCRNADLDHDFDVDADDLNRFILCVSGPAVIADMDCARP